jgi:putative ABC transport system permease protein
MFSLATIAIDIPKHLALDIRSVGANMLVSPADSPDMSVNVVDETVNALPKDCVLAVSGFRFETIRINQQPFIAAGAHMNDALSVKGYWSVEGDWGTRAGDVLLGAEVAQWLHLSVGDSFTATFEDNSIRLRVSGIADTGGNEDALVVMPLADLETLTGSSGVIHLAEFSIAPGGLSLESVADTLNAKMPDITAIVVQRLARSEADVLAMLRSLLSVVSVIVLALTMIGVSTTMTAVVSQQRTEIALRKALGAESSEVISQFMAQALVLGGLGGLLGVGTGYLLADYVSNEVFARGVGFTPWLALLTLGSALITTWVAGFFPIRKAAAVDPANVLREE